MLFPALCNVNIELPYTPVNDGFVPAVQIIPIALFTQAKHKFAFITDMPLGII